jgi:pimeloyl-ACP methyl ester carboxylesterase
VLILTGLDGYRTELAVWQPGFSATGVATAVVEIPGTGDSPAAANDPSSPDRLWSSVLDWVANTQPAIDKRRTVVWGFSTGGYYALRMAHTHADRLLGAVSLGGGADRMFDPAWLERVDQLEYPFDLRGALAEKFGYSGNVEGFMREARDKFSLVRDGTLQKGCCKVLLVNGEGDEIFPIEDLWTALEYGMPKAARVVKGTKHMGEPESFVVVLRWIYELLGLEGDVGDLLRTLPSKMKY